MASCCNNGQKSFWNGCVKLVNEERWDFSPFIKHSLNMFLIGPSRISCIRIHLVFLVQKSIFNYLKVGALRWPWKGTALKDNQVNFCKY